MKTKRLNLEVCSVLHLEKLYEGSEAFERQFGLRVMDGYLEWPEVLPVFIEKIKTDNVPPEWLSYMIIHKKDKVLIGLCGYKGAPDSEGMVEIGYGISYEYRNKGYATEAAQALIDNALKCNEVKIVRAHTLIEINASGRILEKCGMQLIGEAFDPNDGRVWRWETTGKR